MEQFHNGVDESHFLGNLVKPPFLVVVEEGLLGGGIGSLDKVVDAVADNQPTR